MHAPGLDLFEDAVEAHRHAEILDLVDAHIAQGRAGTLGCKSYVAPPADWRRTGQGSETILFGVHVKCNKVQNAAVLPLPPLLEALLDRLEARGISASERPDVLRQRVRGGPRGCRRTSTARPSTGRSAR